MSTATRGWIFFCNDKTQEENFRRGVVGTLSKYLQYFRDLQPGDPVLLYNYGSRALVGHFIATSRPAVVSGSDPWSRRYPAQVNVKLVTQFVRPIPMEELQRVQDLVFDDRGYLKNFSLPVEVVQEVLDLAAGREPGKVANTEEKGFRQKFPATFLASDGHWVRSKAELVIDNWLYTRRIAHAYERRLPIPEEAYADFYIPLGDCYVEYWGLDTSEYSRRQLRKKDLFRQYEFRVVELEEKDVAELDDRLPGKLLKFLPPEYRFR